MTQDHEPEVQVDGWLKTLGIESLCQWDVLVFHHRHQSSLISAETIARFLGYATADVVAALNSLEISGLSKNGNRPLNIGSAGANSSALRESDAFIGPNDIRFSPSISSPLFGARSRRFRFHGL
jgi:hypothetical protein